MVMSEYLVKVSSPEFQLPQVVLDHLPDWATFEEVASAIQKYVTENVPEPELQAYIHIQSQPSAVWDMIHPLSFYPNATITDSAGTVILTEISYPAPNMVRSISAAAFSGSARLS